MAQPIIQTSFSSGEWSPALYAKVDLTKYHSAAALMKNFVVNYHGGAMSRMGTKFVLRGYYVNTAIRLIPFQPSLDISYILEFGNLYIRFISNGAVVLKTPHAITAATQANPLVITVTAADEVILDWIYVTGVNGMTQLNGHYYKVLNVAGNNVTLGDLDGNPINSTGYGAYTSGGTAAVVYKIASPYSNSDLSQIKFVQIGSTMILCHPSHPPYILTLISATNWTLNTITFGSTIGIPNFTGANTSLTAGPATYSYVVTAVDVNGQESGPSFPGNVLNRQDMRAVLGSLNPVWNAIAGAVSYNVYKAQISYLGAPPAGSEYGFIGNTGSTSIIDSNIGPDYSETPPIVANPFQGGSVNAISPASPGNCLAVPVITFPPPTTVGGVTATAHVSQLIVQGTPTVAAGGAGYAAGETVTFANGVILSILTVAAGAITAYRPASFASPGSITAGAVPANPNVSTGTSGAGVGATANLIWGVNAIVLDTGGSGYTIAPIPAFDSNGGGATAITTISGNSPVSDPSVPAFFQQRLVLAAPNEAPATFYMSQPGSYFNYNISNPVQADDSITSSIIGNSQQKIKSLVPVPSGLITFTDKAIWLLNGGSPGSPISAINTVANAQSYVGANNLPPIQANFNVLFGGAKGAVFYDLTYNFYANIYAASDISFQSNHLFDSKTFTEWTWAEVPHKVVWVIRDDGLLMSLAYFKEQEVVGWSHHDTQGLFGSVASVVETASIGATKVDAVYLAVARTIGGQNLFYIERMADRLPFIYNVNLQMWCVDSGLQYNGAPTTSFTGGEHLAGTTVVGLADGIPITPFNMPLNGAFTLPSAASVVTIGLLFNPQLMTLPLDLGEPTIQGKNKKITGVTVRVEETLGLQLGSTLATLVPMKDLILGNVGTCTNQVVTGLVTGDARTIADPRWDTPGQYFIYQPLPYPATILGVIPEITVGDTK